MKVQNLKNLPESAVLQKKSCWVGVSAKSSYYGGPFQNYFLAETSVMFLQKNFWCFGVSELFSWWAGVSTEIFLLNRGRVFWRKKSS
jgi:hypothetical protein